jgi:hypothetical protein
LRGNRRSGSGRESRLVPAWRLLTQTACHSAAKASPDEISDDGRFSAYESGI